MVPATGVIWSTVWSTIARGASAYGLMALPYMNLTLDWHLIIVNWLHQAVSSGLDGSVCAVGWRLCALLKLLPKLMHNTAT